MKRIFLAIFLLVPSVAMADRMTITISIPDGHTSQEYIALFVRQLPVETDEDGNPIMTDAEWVNKKILDWFNNIVRLGARREYQEEQADFVPPAPATRER